MHRGGGHRRAELDGGLRDTVASWQRWSAAHQGYQGPWQELVHHSGRVLQALSYQPTGAIVAAPTTSLPEAIGGERNWDYRYTWVRDACFTLEALWVAACPDEAHQFFDQLAVSAAGSVRGGQELQIMFGIGGEHDLSERTLPHLRGWRDSRPVRVGNGAWNQRQVDVYGELLSAAYRLFGQLNPDHPGATAWREFLVACADLDASNLMMAIVGFLPADEPRMLATIEAIADRLTDERGLVYRYRTSGGVDGLAGEEGTFLLCTFWLAQALALAGQVGRAREVFDRAARYANDVGLLAEEVDEATGELLGNFPQAFSHIGLVNAAWAISEAERG